MDENKNLEKEAQAAVDQVIPQQKKPGRMALQIFAILVLLGLIGLGVYAWQNNRVAKLEDQVAELKKDTVVDKKTEDPYAGWKTYTTKYEKLSFKYPPSMTLVYSSTPGTEQDIEPGTERVALTSDTGLILSIMTGVDGIGGACPDCVIPRSDEITFLGSKSYINFVDQGDGKIYALPVATTKDGFISGVYYSKNITIRQTGRPTINLYSLTYGKDGSSNDPKDLNTYSNDASLSVFKKVLESFSY